MEELSSFELFWRDNYDWLLSRGYKLRARLRPGWIPSWITNPPKSRDTWAYRKREDYVSILGDAMDATRLHDGKTIMLKRICLNDDGASGYETDIACYVSMSALRDEPDNHCVPTYEVLKRPDDDTFDILVMPLLRPFDSPRFETVGEGVDFFQQAFNGLQFLHHHRIAHRDCTRLNIMMECDLYPEGWHAAEPDHNKDYTGPAKQVYTRTQRPPRYLWIDFGLSVHFKDPNNPPVFFRVLGGDKTVPEIKGRYTDLSPYDPFAADIYYLGNLLRTHFIDGYEKLDQPKISGFEFVRPLVNDMVRDNPDERPDIHECVVRLEEIVSSLPTWKLRSQVTYSTDWVFGYIWRLFPYLFRLITFVLLDVPAIPSRTAKPT